MNKAINKMIALAGMMEIMSMPTIPNEKVGGGYSKIPLTKKQKKQRSKNKAARKARKINRN